MTKYVTEYATKYVWFYVGVWRVVLGLSFLVVQEGGR